MKRQLKIETIVGNGVFRIPMQDGTDVPTLVQQIRKSGGIWIEDTFVPFHVMGAIRIVNKSGEVK